MWSTLPPPFTCTPCGKSFLHTGTLAGHRAPADRVGAAIRTFYGGSSSQIAFSIRNLWQEKRAAVTLHRNARPSDFT